MSPSCNLISDPSLFLTSISEKINTNRETLYSGSTSIVCFGYRRNKKSGITRSSRLMLESACIIASKLKLLPEPLELLIQEFGGGINGGGGGNNGFWRGFNWGGGFDGWSNKRRKSVRFGITGIIIILGLGLGLLLCAGKELVLDSDSLLACMGLLLFGLSLGALKKGVKDWVLGFCCCAFLVAFVLKKDEFGVWFNSFGRVKKVVRRKGKVFF